MRYRNEPPLLGEERLDVAPTSRPGPDVAEGGPQVRLDVPPVRTERLRPQATRLAPAEPRVGELVA